MSHDQQAETEVTIRLTGRPATIEDLQHALDTLRAEGIPDSFDVDVRQSQEREHQEGVPYAERPVQHVLVVSASRAAKALRA